MLKHLRKQFPVPGNTLGAPVNMGIKAQIHLMLNIILGVQVLCQFCIQMVTIFTVVENTIPKKCVIFLSKTRIRQFGYLCHFGGREHNDSPVCFNFDDFLYFCRNFAVLQSGLRSTCTIRHQGRFTGDAPRTLMHR